MHTGHLAKSALTRAALAVAVLPLATGCSRASFFSLDNRAGQDVVIEYLDRDTWRKRANAPAGAVTERIPLSWEQRLRVGGCTYSYANGPDSIAAGHPRVEDGGWGPPYVSYLTRLEPDFTLRLFNAAGNGQPGEEVVSDVWPAKPQVDCRTKG
jgi:hypothetical protein